MLDLLGFESIQSLQDQMKIKNLRVWSVLFTHLYFTNHYTLSTEKTFKGIKLAENLIIYTDGIMVSIIFQ